MMALQEMAPLCRFRAGVLESEERVPVILEFDQSPVAVWQRLHPGADLAAYAAQLGARHEEFLAQLRERCLDAQVGSTRVLTEGKDGPQAAEVAHRFTHVFNGIGVLMTGAMVPEVARMPGVRTITLNEERAYLTLDRSVPFTGAPGVWERRDPSDRMVRGEGVVVAVIDTGIDWTHPAFGGYPEVPNEKVLAAISYTGERPLDNYGHGSHVAGIIAADAGYQQTPRGPSRLSGIAPAAKLIGYKVLTGSGTGSATNILLAMEDAVRRGVHVINLSLGDASGDPFSPESSAANNAMLAGVIVVAAAGNSGPERRTVGAPGSAQHVITVGASTDDGVTGRVACLFADAGEMHRVEMRLMEGSPNLPDPALDLPFVSCGLGAKDEEFPRNVRRRIALIRRGEVSFRDKALGAQRAGAAAAVIYNNRRGNFFGSVGEGDPALTIPVIAISQSDGELMLSMVGENGRPSRASLRLNPEEIAQPDRLAEFSSRGPTRALGIKPELTAPGVNIDSATITEAAFPGAGMPDPSGYTSASGTSMAAPHIAGAAALLRQAHPDWTSLQIKAALVGTARPLPEQGSMMDQGNGVIDLQRALDCRAVLVTAADQPAPVHSFGLVLNHGQMASVTQALTIAPLADPGEDAYQLTVRLEGEPAGLTASLSAGSISCHQACVASFDLVLTADGSILADGAYHGWVTAQSEWGILRLPFYYEASRGAAGLPPEPGRAPETQTQTQARTQSRTQTQTRTRTQLDTETRTQSDGRLPSDRR